MPIATDRLAALEGGFRASLRDATAALEADANERAATLEQRLRPPAGASTLDALVGAVGGTLQEIEAAWGGGPADERLGRLTASADTALRHAQGRTRLCTRFCEQLYHAWGISTLTLLCYISGVRLELVGGDRAAPAGGTDSSPRGAGGAAGANLKEA